MVASARARRETAELRKLREARICIGTGCEYVKFMYMQLDFPTSSTLRPETCAAVSVYSDCVRWVSYRSYLLRLYAFLDAPDPFPVEKTMSNSALLSKSRPFSGFRDVVPLRCF